MVSHGEYIVERLLPKFIATACEQLDIQCTSYSDKWVLQLDRADQRHWVIGFEFDLNLAAISGLSSDKVATYQVLSSHDIPAIEHVLIRSRALKGILRENIDHISNTKPVVIKPLQGAGGRGVRKFATLDEAMAYLRPLARTDWALSPWYDIASETRLILLDGEVLCAYEKRQPVISHDLRMFNLGLGAKAHVIYPDKQLVDLALKVVKTVGLRLAVVDIARLKDGDLIVVEINEWVTMEYFARQSDEYYEIAQSVYRRIVERMFE